MASMTEILSPHDADLRPYNARNGKLLMYHGTSDPAISSYGTVDYYNKMAKIVGGQKDVESYPQVAKYVGSGSVDEAANFRCEAPARS